MNHFEHTTEIAEKLNTHLSFDPTILLLGIYSKIYLQHTKMNMYKLFTAGLFMISKFWKQSMCPYIRNPHNEVLCGCKNE